MQKETESDEYTCEAEIFEGQYIQENSKAGKCGGLILYSENKLIVCSNTLDERLGLCYEEALPKLRNMLFPK